MSEEFIPIYFLAIAFVCLAVAYRPLLAAQLFGLAAPLGLIELPGKLQLVIALSLLLVLVAVLERILVGKGPFPADLATAATALWSFGITISVLLSAQFTVSVVFGMWQIIAALVALSWAQLAGRRDRLPQVLAPWLVGATLVAGSGLIRSTSTLQVAYGGAVVAGRPVGVFSQPNEYGTYCMLVFVFALGIAIMMRGWLRWLAVAAVAATGVGLVLSMSRGAWVGAVVGLFVLAMLAPPVRRPLLAGVAVLTGILLTATLFAPDQEILAVLGERVTSMIYPTANPYDDRPALMAEGLREWGTSWIFGDGPNTYPQLSTGIHSVARPEGAEHPHNFWIAIGAEQGIVGVVAMLGFAVAIWQAAGAARSAIVRAAKHSPAWDGRRWGSEIPAAAAVTVAGAAALGGFLAEGLFDYPMRNALSRATVWIMIGWVLAGRRAMSSVAAGVAVPAARGSSS